MALIGVQDWNISKIIRAGRAQKDYERLWCPDGEYITQQVQDLRSAFPFIRIRYSNRTSEDRYFLLVLPDGSLATQHTDGQDKVRLGDPLAMTFCDLQAHPLFDLRAHGRKWISAELDWQPSHPTVPLALWDCSQSVPRIYDLRSASRRSLLHLSMTWPIATPLFVFAALYIAVFLCMPEGSYALDPKDVSGGKGTFEPHNKNYMELAKLVIGLGSASIGAIAIFFFRNDATINSIQQRIKWPLVFFVATVVYGVAFIGLLVWRYERYCHRPDSYLRP